MRACVFWVIFLGCVLTHSLNIVINTPSLSESYKLFSNLLKNKHAVMLVEDTPECIQTAFDFASEVSDIDVQFSLMKFNSSGVTTILETSLNDTRNVQKALKFRGVEKSTSNTNSLPFFAILHAAQILPTNSSIILFTDAENQVDERLAGLARDFVLKKHISVNIVWDKSPNTLNGLLKELSIKSDGGIFALPESKFRNPETPVEMNFQMSTIFLKKNLQGKEEDVSFAVDSDVTGLNIIVDPINTASVVLSSAGGLKMYFSKNAIGDDAKKFSTQSFSEYQEDVLEVHLNFSGKLSTTGVWKIAVEGADWLYNVAVFGFTSIVAQAFIDKKIDYKFPKDIVKLGVSGNVREITDIFFVDNIGHSASNFTYKFNESEKYVAGDNKTQHVNIEIDKNPNIQLPLYALIKGKDAQGHTFERLGYVGNHRGLFPSDPLTVDVGVGSELITKGQSRPQVFFEVTNQGNDVVTVTFTCSDQKYILQSLSTYRKVLSPLESTIVTLTLNTKGGVYQDEITFSAKAGSVFVQKKILVDVDSFNYFDDTEPRIDYSYTSDCTDVIFSKCEKGTWTIEITAQDLDSGLLQLNTIPKGLYVPNSYTAGTTEAVKGFYSDSCCNPNLKIIAIDRLNNRRIYTVNAYHARWSPGAIAALVLGIILFILLIVLIVWLVVRWKKQKESYDLPTYRGGGI